MGVRRLLGTHCYDCSDGLRGLLLHAAMLVAEFLFMEVDCKVCKLAVSGMQLQALPKAYWVSKVYRK